MGTRCLFCSVALSLTACGSPEGIIVDTRVEADELVVELAPDLYGWTCDPDQLQLELLDPGTLPAFPVTDPDRVGNAEDGYWIDGAFRYPNLDEGCDVLACVPVETLRVGRSAYLLVGSDAPPDDLQAWLDDAWQGGEAAEVVDVVEGVRYDGRVQLRVEVHRQEGCVDPAQTDRVTLDVPSDAP